VEAVVGVVGVDGGAVGLARGEKALA
jgi:hypothetical protein